MPYIESCQECRTLFRQAVSEKSGLDIALSGQNDAVDNSVDDGINVEPISSISSWIFV